MLPVQYFSLYFMYKTHTVSWSMDNYLSWCIGVNELLVDFLGFGAQLGGCLCVLVVLTGKVERNVFLTVLGQQECSEGAQPICTQNNSILFRQ